MKAAQDVDNRLPDGWAGSCADKFKHSCGCFYELGVTILNPMSTLNMALLCIILSVACRGVSIIWR